MSLCLPEKEREREERLVPRGWVPLEITPSIRGQTQKRGPGGSAPPNIRSRPARNSLYTEVRGLSARIYMRE